MVLLYLPLSLLSFLHSLRFFLFLLSRLYSLSSNKTRTHINTNTMLLGKRQRPPINRTTSLSEIKFDLNLPCDSSSEASSDQQKPNQNSVTSPFGSVVDQRLLDQRFLSMVSPRGNLRRHSGDFSDAGHFLRSCSLCERLLVPGRDIYMYRGDTAFCSLECRQQQMAQDEKKEKGKTVKEPSVATTPRAKPGKGIRAATAV